jgi:hypothetical protein
LPVTGDAAYQLGTATTATIQIEDAMKIIDPTTDPQASESWEVTVIASDP